MVDMPKITDPDQVWWRITCVYEGRPGCVAAAIGRDQAEAVSTFLGSLANPDLAKIESVTFIGIGGVSDALLKL
jgi:hypothetical protein